MSSREEISSEQKEALRSSPSYAVACGLAYLAAKDPQASERIERVFVTAILKEREAEAVTGVLASIVLAIVDLRDKPEPKRMGRKSLPGFDEETDFYLTTFVDRKKLEDNWPVKKSVAAFMSSRPDLRLTEGQLAKRYTYLKRAGLKVRDI